MTQNLNLDVSGYPKAKAAKTAAIIKINGAVHYSAQRFDPITGKAEPQVAPLVREHIETSLAGAREMVATLELLLKDFDAAKEVMK
jgi:hypothetical protein